MSLGHGWRLGLLNAVTHSDAQARAFKADVCGRLGYHNAHAIVVCP